MSSTEIGEHHIPILSVSLVGILIYASMQEFKAESTTHCYKHDKLNTCTK